MTKKLYKVVLFFIAIALFILFSITFPYRLFLLSNDEIILDKDNYNDLFNNKYLSVGKIALADDGEDKLNEYIVNYKLFNMFNILSLKVKVGDNSVYLGGDCLGFSLQTKGLLVVGSNYIFTKNGVINPFTDSGLQTGDVITEINGNMIETIDELNEILNNSNGEPLKLGVSRLDRRLELSIKPQLDMFTNEYKLGLWIKNSTEGVGTLTFVDDDNLRFASLGHAIYLNGNDEPLKVSGGEIYDCNVVGIKKGIDGVPGEIMGAFSKTDPQGNIDKNCDYGVYGYIKDNAKILDDKKLIGVGGKASVVPGKAQILCSLDGENIKPYEIEIIKVNYQNASSQKSLVFRVVDKNLIGLTGGIIQGMSGSPIVQNGKLIGAVTHVFVNDPTKGFGIYADWMLLE